MAHVNPKFTFNLREQRKKRIGEREKERERRKRLQKRKESQFFVMLNRGNFSGTFSGSENFLSGFAHYAVIAS